MDLTKLLEKRLRGEQLTAEEVAFVARELGTEPGPGAETGAAAAQLRRLVNEEVNIILAPLLAVQRTLPPAQHQATNTYTPRINGYSDVLHRMFRGESIDSLIELGLLAGAVREDGTILQRALTTTGTSALVPTEYSRDIVSYIGDYGVARQEALVVQTQANTLSLITNTAGMTAYYTDEATAITQSSPTYSAASLTAKKLAVLSEPISRELMEDALVDLTQEIGMYVADALAYAEDNQMFNGTGSPFTGILQNSSVTDVELAGAVEQITYSVLNKVPYATRSNRLVGAKWYMHRSILELLMDMKDTQGRPICRESMRAGEPTTLLGYPVTLVEAMPGASTITAGKRFIAFGNLKRSFTFYDRQMLEVAILKEATLTSGINLAETDQVAIRNIERHMMILRRPGNIVCVKLAAAA